MIRQNLQRFSRILLPRSLRYQLLSRSLFILAGLLLLIGLFQYVVMQQFLYKNKAGSMQDLINSVPADLWNRSADTPRKGHGDLFFPEASVAFLTGTGEFIVVSENPKAGTVPMLRSQDYLDALQQPDRREPFYKFVKDDRGNELLTVLQPVRHGRAVTGVVQMSTRTALLQDVLYRQLFIFAALASLALIIGLLTFLPIIRRTLAPLSRIVGTVERIDSGTLDERLPTQQGQTELDRLSVSFNRMLGRLEDSFAAEREAKEQMRRFVADASHEMRTPLTSIHGFLEVLLRGAAAQPEQLEKSLKSMYAESGRINKLVGDLLLLARLDRTPALERKPCALGEIVREMDPQFRLLAGGRKVSLHIATGRETRLDPDKMKQVILNLFQNAVQHTDPGDGRISVEVYDRSGGIELAVGDNGPGIPPEHLPHVFERFYRSDLSRARKYGGAGLGLAITKSLVDLHAGSIGVESRLGEGSIFRVWIPADVIE